MPRFAYTGRAAAGAVSGELDGADAGAIASLLMARGVTPLRIEAAGKAAGSEPRPTAAGGLGAPVRLPAALEAWMQPKVLPADTMLFSRQLHTLLRAGVPILRALAGLQDSTVNQRFRQVLGGVRASLESDIELSICFAQQGGVFDNFYVSMVRVGEMTGRLDEVFMRLFKHIEFEQFMRQQVKAALRYPAFVISAMAVAVGVINALVVPAFADVFKSLGAELPLATRILVTTSNFTLHWWWLLLGGAAGAVVLWRRWVITPAGRQAWDRLVLRLPLAGRIVQKATLARFARR